MCGIIAWAGKSPKKFDKDKLNLLGSYNEERGIHSCGISVDGNISLGVNKNKVFKDFIVNVGYDNPIEIPVVIGHTRHATFGIHNADNAHPFGFGKHKKGFTFIGVHNGSLLNHKEIANNFGVNHVDNKKKNKAYSLRDKIDSEVLLECIYKNKDFKVLSKYNGAAALVFQDLTRPNVIYCWHGASKKYNNDKEDKIWEERPLFYYKETRNSLYISSMKNSLKAIGGNKSNIDEFEHNTLYIITDGNIEKAEKLIISRIKCHHLKSSNNYNNDYRRNDVGKNFKLDGLMTDDEIEEEEWYKHQGSIFPYNRQNNIDYKNKSLIKEHFNTTERIEFNIYNEKIPTVNMFSKTYIHKLRYWKQNDLLKGCYVFIENFGFYFLASTLKKAEEQFWNIVNKEFFAGEFVFTNQKFTSKNKAFIPFSHNYNKNEIINPPLFFFYEGIRVLEYLDYKRCLDSEANGNKFEWESLSHCSAHPIIDIDHKNKTALTQNIKFKDKLFTDTICLLGSNKIYTIKDGNCIFIEEKGEKDEKKYDNLDSIMNELSKNENLILKEEQSKSKITSLTIVNSNENFDLLEKAIDEIFKLVFQKFPMDIKRLQNYKNQSRAQDAILLLEGFLKESRYLINLELKE